MSDSETGDVPSEATIARSLRDVVISIHKSGNTGDLTVKRVRARAEGELGLPSGFLKLQDWKQKSQDLIRDAVDKYCGDDDAEPEPASAPTPPKKAAKAKSAPQQKVTLAKESTRGVKRKAISPVKKIKKRRKTVSSEEIISDAPEESELSDAESEPPKKLARRQKQIVVEESDEEDVPDAKIEPDNEEDKPTAERKRTPPHEPKGDASESELSSLLDESPVKKKRQKASEKPKNEAKSKSSKPSTSKPKLKADNDPDQSEIKRLQSWLVKCGIRKVWGKELASYDTSKEKIKHLKAMLTDAGMGGKYSVEKAAAIKEKREFAKDLEDIQAGAAAWGKQEVTQTGRPRRAANRPVPKPTVPVFSDDSEEGQEGADEDDDDDEASSDENDDNEDDDVKADSDKSESEGDARDDSE